jgi:hypothetical protein
MKYVYCHPLFDERKCSHRFSYQLKAAFEEAGMRLERFDYRGTGEAAGEFSDVSLRSLREDVAGWIDGDEVCLVGVRFGASLAFDYCVRGRGPMRNLVLLEPVVEGRAYVDYLRRKQHIKDLMTGESSVPPEDKGYENLEGYKTSVKLMEQLESFDLIELACEYVIENSICIAQISKQSKIHPEIASLAKLLEGSANKVVVENVEVPMFWERIGSSDYTKLTEKVLEWCRG